MIRFETQGDWSNLKRWLGKSGNATLTAQVESIAQEGVAALVSATPKRSGKTAASWSYNVKRGSNSLVVEWTNSHVNDGVPIAIIIQTGHGTGTGGYVQGIDYINPAMKPVFDRLAERLWRAVTN